MSLLTGGAAVNRELQQYFMQRWKSMIEARDSHPYAQWVTVLDPRCSAACRDLYGKAWRVDGKVLSDLVHSHIAQQHSDCRCRLRSMSLAAIAMERIQTMD